MMQIGFSLVDANGTEVQRWGDVMGQMHGCPSVIRLPNGDDVHCITGAMVLQDWRLVLRYGEYGAAPGVVFDGNRIIATFPVTQAMVQAERERRLAEGFNYDFGDERGLHHIGTTPADMVGWTSVTTLAQAAINLGAPGTLVHIVTNTGPVSVTAMEWQTILVAAGQFQQPIWAASFQLQAMTPIPADYTSNAHWAP